MDYQAAVQSQLGSPGGVSNSVSGAQLTIASMTEEAQRQNEQLRGLISQLCGAADHIFGSDIRPLVGAKNSAGDLGPTQTLASLSIERNILLNELKDVISRF